MKANENIRADKALNLVGNILGDFNRDDLGGAESKGDAQDMADNMKEQYGSAFEKRRAMLAQKLGGGGTEKLARVQQRAEALQSEATTLFGSVNTTDEALQLMRSNPKFLQSVNKQVFSSIEDLIKGVHLPGIADKKDWGSYRIWNMAVKRFVREPRMQVEVTDCVRIEIRDIELEFEHFDFELDRRVFPKVKDKGKGAISCNCWAGLEFEIGMDAQKKIEVKRIEADVTIDALPMSVVKCNHKHVFKTLMKMFQKKGKVAAQDEIRQKVKEKIPVIRDKVQALFQQFGGKEKLNEMSQAAKTEAEPCAEDDDDSDYASSESDISDDEDDGGEYKRLVVDVGYGTTKYGFAGADNITPNVLRNTADDDRKYVHAITREKMNLMNVNWEQIENMWEWIFESGLKVDSDDCTVVSTVSPYGPREYPEKLAEMLFETHEVPGIYLGVPAVFCLFAQGKTTGVVVDSGECITSTIPVYDGIPITSAVKQTNFGGRDISKYIEGHLQMHGINVQSVADLDVVDKIKKSVCTCGPANTEHGESFLMPDGREVQIDEHFPVAISNNPSAMHSSGMPFRQLPQ
eukprot:SAG31_NODE_399_length_16247_cov_19.137540_9_plen_575_part_00